MPVQSIALRNTACSTRLHECASVHWESVRMENVWKVRRSFNSSARNMAQWWSSMQDEKWFPAEWLTRVIFMRRTSSKRAAPLKLMKFSNKENDEFRFEYERLFTMVRPSLGLAPLKADVTLWLCRLRKYFRSDDSVSSLSCWSLRCTLYQIVKVLPCSPSSSFSPNGETDNLLFNIRNNYFRVFANASFDHEQLSSKFLSKLLDCRTP